MGQKGLADVIELLAIAIQMNDPTIDQDSFRSNGDESHQLPASLPVLYRLSCSLSLCAFCSHVLNQ